MLHVQFIVVCSKIVLYVFFIIYCTMLHFGFLCSLFGLFCCSDTKTPRPCSTNKVGGSHRFPLPTSPKDPIVELLLEIFWLSFIKNYYPIANSHKPSWFDKPSTIELTWATTYYLPLHRFKILVHMLHYTSVVIPHKYSARGKLWLRCPHCRPTFQVRYQVALKKK